MIDKNKIDIEKIYTMAEYLAKVIIDLEPRLGPKQEFLSGFVMALNANNISAMIEGYNDLVETIKEFSDLIDRPSLDKNFHILFDAKLDKIRR